MAAPQMPFQDLTRQLLSTPFAVLGGFTNGLTNMFNQRPGITPFTNQMQPGQNPFAQNMPQNPFAPNMQFFNSFGMNPFLRPGMNFGPGNLGIGNNFGGLPSIPGINGQVLNPGWNPNFPGRFGNGPVLGNSGTSIPNSLSAALPALKGLPNPVAAVIPNNLSPGTQNPAAASQPILNMAQSLLAATPTPEILPQITDPTQQNPLADAPNPLSPPPTPEASAPECLVKSTEPATLQNAGLEEMEKAFQGILHSTILS